MKKILILGLLLLCPQIAFAQAPTKICVESTDARSCVPVSPAAPFPVAATASISGFTPNLNFATLTATASSASVALPAGATVYFQNVGTTTVSCTLGVGSATALASQIIVQPSSGVPVVVGSNTFGACIDQTGSASNLIVLAGGSGLGNAFGGGSGGGGGGAVTVANGADVTQGALADAACAGGGSACSVNARLAHLENLGNSALIGQTGVGNINIGAVETYAPIQNTIAVSQTAQIMSATQGGGTGVAGDYLSHCNIQPTNTSPGSFQILNNATVIYNFPGGASSVSTLISWPVPIGSISSGGGWKITNGANITGTCFGKFS